MGLKSAMESLLQIKNKALPLLNLSVNDIENCNLLTLAILLVQDAQQKKENKGVFYNLDLV
jgi:aspartate oxidase